MANLAFKESVTRGVSYALKEVRHRYDYPLNPRDCLPYHNHQHTVEVIDRTNEILLAAPDLVTTRDLYLARFAAAFHDIDQTWEEVEDVTTKFPILKRKRKVGEVERKSFEEAKKFMDEENLAGKIFDTPDYEIVEASIMATVPHFENGTVTQPYVTNTSPFIAQAIALADLGVAGMVGFPSFLRDTDSLFREDNLDFVDITLDRRALSEAHKRFLRERVLDGVQRQIRFAEGRRDYHESELANLPLEARGVVRALFNKFPETIAEMTTTLARRRAMSYGELILSMA